MSASPLKIAMIGFVLQLAAPAFLNAQTETGLAKEPASPETLPLLEQRIDHLTEALAAAQRQIDEDHRKMLEMETDFETLRNSVTNSAASSAEQANTNAAGQLRQAVAEIREEQEVLASQVEQHDQTKLESASKLPVRFHGMVLFNAFVNEGIVDQPDIPTSAMGRAPGQSHGSAGAGLRQTMLSFEGIGPRLWNGRISADVSMDFVGGVTAGVLSAPSGLARLRTGGVNWESENDLLRVGYDGPIISPLSPDSFAEVGQPSLAWSGNLWVWSPQLSWEHRFTLAGDRQAGFELGAYDPSYRTLNSLEASRSVSPGEAARQPGYELRLFYRTGKTSRALQVGASGYYDREDYGNDQIVNAWAGTVDWRIPATSRGQWSGEFYRGLGIGSLGGGAYRDAYSYSDPATGAQDISGLDSIGGWTQWQWNFKQTMQLNAAAGQDTGYGSELRESQIQYSNPLDYYARNRSLMANFVFRPWSTIILSPEFRHITSWPITGHAAWANVYTLSAGYQF